MSLYNNIILKKITITILESLRSFSIRLALKDIRELWKQQKFLDIILVYRKQLKSFVNCSVMSSMQRTCQHQTTKTIKDNTTAHITLHTLVHWLISPATIQGVYNFCSVYLLQLSNSQNCHHNIKCSSSSSKRLNKDWYWHCLQTGNW